MGKDTIKFDMIDDLNMCLGDVDAFFNILRAVDWDDPTIVEIACAGKTLARDMFKRVEEACDFVQNILGEIKIERTWSPLPGSGPGEIVGLKLTASKVFNKVLRERKSDADLCVEISPTPTIRAGILSFISGLERTQNTVREGHLGLHDSLQRTRETVRELDQFINKDFVKIMDIREDFKQRGEAIAQKLQGNKSISEVEASEELPQAQEKAHAAAQAA